MQTNPKAVFQAALNYCKQGRLEKAQELLEENVKSLPLDPLSHLHLSYFHLSIGDKKQALLCLEQAIILNPNDFNTLLLQAKTLQEIGYYAKAAQVYDQILKKDPSHHDSLLQLGRLYLFLGKASLSLDVFRSAVSLHPESPPLLHELAQALCLRGYEEAALSACEKALTLEPNQAEYLLTRSYLLKDWESCELYYQPPSFDSIASTFEENQKILQYQAPQRIFDDLKEFLPESKFSLLDLGCGTGLGAESFASLAQLLVGIDSSRSMIDIAQKKQIFDDLIVGDLLPQMLLLKDESFDLLLAIELFPYFIDLESIFEQAFRLLRPQGLMAFTTEYSEENAKQLELNMRWSHSTSWIESLIDETDFKLLKSELFPLHIESNKTTDGQFFIIQKLSK